MKKVLLTGANNGLIGDQAIEPLLEAGFEVFAVSFADRERKEKNLHWIKTDLLNFENCKNVFKEIRPEYLLHLDWYAEPTNRLAGDTNFYWVQASLEMLKIFNLHGGKRAVYVGTCFEYEMGDEPLNEFNTKISPLSSFAKYKNNLHQLAALYANEKNISFGWGRIFYVYGDHDLEKRLIPHVVENLSRDKEVVITADNLVRDYMFPCELGKAFTKFLDSDVTGPVNVCSQIPIQMKDLMNYIGEKLDKKHLIKFEDKDAEGPSIVLGDNKRLINEVKFTPTNSIYAALNNLLLEHNLIVE